MAEPDSVVRLNVEARAAVMIEVSTLPLLLPLVTLPRNFNKNARQLQCEYCGKALKMREARSQLCGRALRCVWSRCNAAPGDHTGEPMFFGIGTLP